MLCVSDPVIRRPAAAELFLENVYNRQRIIIRLFLSVYVEILTFLTLRMSSASYLNVRRFHMSNRVILRLVQSQTTGIWVLEQHQNCQKTYLTW